MIKTKKICTRCIYDEHIPNISFSDDGICNYCDQIDFLKKEYGTGKKKGRKLLKNLINKIKKEGQSKKYDCVVGVSGGTDSSYLLMKAKEWGLKPLAVHYDNTWNTATASMNIAKVTKYLDIDLFTYVVDNKEVNDMKLSFLRSGVPEFDADTDIAFVQILRQVAANKKIKYILEGHSFITEGISPVGSNYFDGGYVADIHKKFGELKMKSYPNMTFFQFMKWILLYRQKFIRPLWYIDYSKEEAKKILSEKMGWQYYDGHHLENRASWFTHTLWLPRYRTDFRYLTLAANVRNNKIKRITALKEMKKPIIESKMLINYVKKRLDLNHNEYKSIMNGTKRTWREFKTYKKRFEILKPIFYILMKLNLVPVTFYQKYCNKID